MRSAETDVIDGWLRWVDAADHSKGAVNTRRRARKEDLDREGLIAAGNMRDAWMTRQSGYAGPLVLQLL